MSQHVYLNTGTVSTCLQSLCNQGRTMIWSSLLLPLCGTPNLFLLVCTRYCYVSVVVLLFIVHCIVQFHSHLTTFLVLRVISHILHFLFWLFTNLTYSYVYFSIFILPDWLAVVTVLYFTINLCKFALYYRLCSQSQLTWMLFGGGKPLCVASKLVSL